MARCHVAFGIVQAKHTRLSTSNATRASIGPGPFAYSRDTIALGDFNMPEGRRGGPIFDELTERGLRVPDRVAERHGHDAPREFVEPRRVNGLR